MKLVTLHSQSNEDIEQCQENQRKDLRIAVIGYGNYGRALSSRLETCGVSFVVGTRRFEEKAVNLDGLNMINFVSYSTAVEKSDVIILAIPFEAYEDVVRPLTGLLRGKIVIDVSNADKTSELCHADHLSELIPSSYVVKAFNTISAWSMEQDIYGASRNTFVCSNDVTARHVVMQLAQDIGFTPVERGSLKTANLLEKKSLELFVGWRTAFWITIGLLVFQTAYFYVRLAAAYKPSVWAKYASLKYPNRIMGWMALWLLAIVFLGGCIAGFLQLIRGTKYMMFPSWLTTWLKARKQLGLFALMFAAMHTCLSLVLLTGGYFRSMSVTVKINGTRQYLQREFRVHAEFSLLFATLSVFLLGILGIASLPSVNQSMTWREWDFIQSTLGYLAMFFGFLHIVIYTYKLYDPARSKSWKNRLPHHAFLMVLLPAIVMFLKLLLLLPGVSCRLRNIRKGLERKRGGYKNI